MKVAITLTLDIDPETWDLMYGTGTTATEVRADVKRYVREQVAGSAAGEADAITATAVR